MMNSPKAIIVMATYNGAKYISMQLDSIINQTFDNWHLIISDDKSTDGTIDILKCYEKQDARIEVVSHHGCRGAYSNYYDTISIIKEDNKDDADFFFFCDQDDIWDAEKLQIEINDLNRLESKYGRGCPILCYSDMQIIGDDDHLSLRMSDISDISLNENPLNVFFSHRYVWGTTVAINRALWDRVDLPYRRRNDLSHDNWYAKHAILLGHIYYIDRPLVKYRRHDHNVTNLPQSAGVRSAYMKLCRFSESVDVQSHVFWSSLEAAESADEESEMRSRLIRAFDQGGLFAVKFMAREHICPGRKLFPQLARYLVLGLRLHRRTRWFSSPSHEQ